MPKVLEQKDENMIDKVKLINFDRKAWNGFLKEVKEGRFDHKVAKGLLEKINSPSYWVDSAKTTGFASEQTFDTFEKWLNLVEQGIMESPSDNRTIPVKLAEMIAGSSLKLLKESKDLFEGIVASGNPNFIESACLEYCRRLVRVGEFEIAVAATVLLGETLGEKWSEKFSPYFERLPVWNALAEQRFREAFTERATLYQEVGAPRLVKFEFTEPVEDELEKVIYEIAIDEIFAGKLSNFDPKYACALGRLTEVLTKRGEFEMVAEVKVELKLELELALESKVEAPETLLENLVESLLSYGIVATKFVLDEISEYAAENDLDSWYDEAVLKTTAA